MNVIFTITKKEFKDFFLTPVASIFISVFLILSFWFFFSNFFVTGQADLRGFFSLTPILLLVFIPTITMGQWADEKKRGTIELLFTLPLKDHEVAIGKFLASLLLMVVALLLTLPLVLTVDSLGSLDWGPVWGGFLGLVFLCASCISIGLFVSSLTESSMVAFIITFLVLFFLYFIGESFIVQFVPDFLGTIFESLSLSGHYESVARGVIDSRDVIYYVSITGFFIYLNILSVESRKWESNG